jgi:erythromycin esterase-like protein
MSEQGEWNVGELMRKRWPDETFLLGFTTYDGSVRAASEWDEPAIVKQVVPGLPGSWEALFHEVGLQQFLLLPTEGDGLRQLLDEPLLERAIGVIYLPENERRSHYFTARIGAQFDAVVHIDRTSALRALDDGTAAGSTVEAPETYPEGV